MIEQLLKEHGWIIAPIVIILLIFASYTLHKRMEGDDEDE